MADPILSTPTDEPAEDPIVEAQNAVMEATALLECIAKMLESPECYRSTDIIAACSGVIRILGKVGDDLEPEMFRKAVLASEPAGEVSNGC
jgi:hypothetical protein